MSELEDCLERIDGAIYLIEKFLETSRQYLDLYSAVQDSLPYLDVLKEDGLLDRWKMGTLADQYLVVVRSNPLDTYFFVEPLDKRTEITAWGVLVSRNFLGSGFGSTFERNLVTSEFTSLSMLRLLEEKVPVYSCLK